MVLSKPGLNTFSQGGHCQYSYPTLSSLYSLQVKVCSFCSVLSSLKQNNYLRWALLTAFSVGSLQQFSNRQLPWRVLLNDSNLCTTHCGWYFYTSLFGSHELNNLNYKLVIGILNSPERIDFLSNLSHWVTQAPPTPSLHWLIPLKPLIWNRKIIHFILEKNI